ncbi:DUF5131 family protein [Roseibium sediminicola]|uniref:Phage Gp37/Gp68 family protein n=1 Tax=Roseibium sediminicola TaxID=2933272 RepID=A0ABT0H0J5_9HYPH|nr:phage Gp37/Gp68 family protein [Roseibium sp. CAU 1639]MCK7615201.1 phage Gp37/Gp68 family protein [Roseibium sp. CAU 1639]
MADSTAIEWTDATWNIINGCSLVSDGCKYCYAADLAATRLKNLPSRKGLAKKNAAGVAQFNGQVRFNDAWLDQPLKWKKPRRIFVCAHGDLFHENVPDEWLDKVFAVMALCPQHTFQILTKRPERMRKYLADARDLRWMVIEGEARAMGYDPRGLNDDGFDWLANKGFLPNVWLGTSIEDQATADTRIPYLLKTPAAVRFVSAEPLLGPVDLRSVEGGTLWIGGQRGCGGKHWHVGRRGDVIHGVKHDCDPSFPHHHHDERCGPGLDWVIAGGESGDKARPMHPDWPRALRDQCAAAGVAFMFKQWGAWWAINQMDEADYQPLYRSNRKARPGEDQDKLDDIWGRTCTVPQLVLLNDGRHDAITGGRAFMPGTNSVLAYKVGKGNAGRVLDGVTHDGFPEVLG